MGRPERSAAKSKGDGVGAPGSARGDPLGWVVVCGGEVTACFMCLDGEAHLLYVLELLMFS